MKSYTDTNISLFLRDAGIEFNDVRHAYNDTWPATSAKLKEQGITRTDKVPALLINGLVLNQVSSLSHCYQCEATI